VTYFSSDHPDAGRATRCLSHTCRCPGCGHEFLDAWETVGRVLYELLRCPECDRHFFAIRAGDDWYVTSFDSPGGVSYER